MTYSAKNISASDELTTVNRRLAELLLRPPANLAAGADAALNDDLVLCGVLGGKDVGKSTLINALAQTRVSVDAGEVGRGTDRTIAYVHENARDAVAHRLESIDRHVTPDVALHQADPIQNVVLLDLPDFDSEFLDHLAMVRDVAPLLDRILWVLTPRKVGDRAWVQMLNDVVKDAGNVHCVLNKVDELLADNEPFEKSGNGSAGRATDRGEKFWIDQHRWVAHSTNLVGYPQTDDHRFLVAAAFPDVEPFVGRIGRLWNDPDWSTYRSDRDTVTDIAKRAARELERLRDCVLSPVSSEQGQAIKSANRRQEDRVNVARIEDHFAIEQTADRLFRACDPIYHQRVVQQSLDASYCSGVAEALQNQLRPDRSLADELLERRVEGWPLLRLVYWPFGWLSRVVGASGALNPTPRSPRSAESSPSRGRNGIPTYPEPARNHGPHSPDDPFDAIGTPLQERINAIRSHILADHAVIAGQLKLEADLPTSATIAENLRNAAQRLAPTLEQRLLDDIRGKDRRPSWLGKMTLWFLFLWFPFLQPVFAGLLEMFEGAGAWNITHGLYRIVTALSAAHLLTGFAVVTAIFVAILAGMYARALRAVRTARHEQDASSPLIELVDELIVSEVVLPLAGPFQNRLERLESLRARLRLSHQTPPDTSPAHA